MKAIILVGGQATRLRPLTDTLPKAMIELQGKTVLEHVIDLFKRHELRDITLSVGYLKEKIIEYFGDGQKFGVRIEYIKEEEPLGTAGPLHLLKERFQEPFVVCNGDELKDIDIDSMLDFHKKNQSHATLALLEVDDPSMYGVARLDGEKILEFVEKPKKEEAPSNLINAGFYILDPEVFKSIPKGRAMFEFDVFPRLAESGKLFGYRFQGQWFDTGNFERLERARKEWRGVRKFLIPNS